MPCDPNVMKNILEEDVRIIPVLKYKIGFFKVSTVNSHLHTVLLPSLPLLLKQVIGSVEYSASVPVMLSKSVIRVESEAQSVSVSLLAGLFYFGCTFFLWKDPYEKLENHKFENVNS